MSVCGVRVPQATHTLASAATVCSLEGPSEEKVNGFLVYVRVCVSMVTVVVMLVAIVAVMEVLLAENTS